eukprot:CAMPEP_0171078010 /NCGR_PEP_ID=MMETSP0766_2-20121228/14387_1 /TAXON_ID=439317 /ORGANISM="Gambierdiscus australes, Strain CAWD 149" /LENGTH=116 /DNA_ID=CAMNT_0011535105 /DNA_START=190 /DNA_END=540 /DNA_ORIENTATION=+
MTPKWSDAAVVRTYDRASPKAKTCARTKSPTRKLSTKHTLSTSKKRTSCFRITPRNVSLRGASPTAWIVQSARSCESRTIRATTVEPSSGTATTVPMGTTSIVASAVSTASPLTDA